MEDASPEIKTKTVDRNVLDEGGQQQRDAIVAARPAGCTEETLIDERIVGSFPAHERGKRWVIVRYVWQCV